MYLETVSMLVKQARPVEMRQKTELYKRCRVRYAGYGQVTFHWESKRNNITSFGQILVINVHKVSIKTITQNVEYYT